MLAPSFMDSLKKARTYGLGEFLEIIGELSQESTKKGVIDRKHKELITLGIALAKDSQTWGVDKTAQSSKRYHQVAHHANVGTQPVSPSRKEACQITKTLFGISINTAV